MKGQALAIAAVIAAGVTMYVTYLSNFDSLQRTRAAYYAEARFADVFASLTRAPAWLAGRIAAIPGVAAVDTRVVADVTLTVAGMTEPAVGRLISIPDRGAPGLNSVHLRRGRWIDPARPDEVLASERFCEAHGLAPGDAVSAVINGRYRRLTIVGVALSPEYVYAIRPGEIFPDARRFGVFWMNRAALGAAFNMEGAFNDVAAALGPGASEPAVVAELDRLLAPYGGRGAIPRSLQPSAWTLENELAQLQLFGFLVPAIFFGVAAFVLHVALTRALALQRAQIAAMKALGYATRTLAWHYIKWALVIAAAGAVAGVAAGAWLGAWFITIYNEFFRFPVLSYRLSGGVAAQAVAGSLTVAALGAVAAVRRAVRVPPAEAMRPEAPARYRRSLLERLSARLRPSLATRMVLRNLERQPGRALISTVGIAFAVAVLFVGLAFIDVMDALINEQFTRVMRQDATVAFVEPRAARAIYDVRHLPGVLDAEPLRTVPVRLRAGARARTLALTGLPDGAHLNRVVDRRGRAVPLPPQGLVLSEMLGVRLGVAPGDELQVEILEGRRPTRRVPVAMLVDDTLGLQAHMRLDELGRLLGEGDAISAVALTLDPARRDRFYDEVKVMPVVAGVELREATLQNFRETLAEHMNLSIFINVIFAAIIAFGVVYNSARVSLSERSRELASLRVLGFTRAEISLILLGELAVLTLAALPLGALIGELFGELIIAAFSNEIYRLSFVAEPATIAWSWLIVSAAAAVSGLLVRRRLDHLDLVAVLKTQE
ncbi:MAG: ABC transporter permease [Acidobacteria bacterium]|nr:ABC transporter permease [Acidobacteriota bacterium]